MVIGTLDAQKVRVLGKEGSLIKGLILGFGGKL